jgi:hypothetical protein
MGKQNDSAIVLCGVQGAFPLPSLFAPPLPNQMIWRNSLSGTSNLVLSCGSTYCSPLGLATTASAGCIAGTRDQGALTRCAPVPGPPFTPSGLLPLQEWFSTVTYRKRIVTPGVTFGFCRANLLLLSRGSVLLYGSLYFGGKFGRNCHTCSIVAMSPIRNLLVAMSPMLSFPNL